MRVRTSVIAASALAGCVFSIDESKIGARDAEVGPGVVDDAGANADGDARVTPRDAGPDGAGDGAPTRGLVGYWSFDDETGTAAQDQSPNGHHGVLTGNIVRDEGAPGHGRGVSTTNLNVGNGTFSVPALNGTRFPQQAGTLSYWFRVRTPPAADSTTTWALFDANAVDGRFHFSMGVVLRTNPALDVFAAGVARGTVAMASEAVSFDEGEAPVRAEWHRVIVTWNGSQLAMHFGQAGKALRAGTASYSAFTPNQQEFVFLRTLLADLDEVRLYNRVLSAEEIRDLP